MAASEDTRELSALLIAPDRELASGLAAALGEGRAFRLKGEMEVYPAMEALEARLKEMEPEVVLLDVASDFRRAAELLRQMSGARPAIPVIGLHPRNDSDAILRSLREGASEFLCAPFDPIIQRQAAARIRRLIEPAVRAKPGAARVLAFSSAKPGSGASTLAAQTAFAVRRRTEEKIVLADMDLMSATMTFYGQLGDRAVPAAGVDVVAVADASDLGPLVERARRRCGWTVLDLPSVFYRASQAALPLLDRLYLVTTAELASLHLAHRAVNLLAERSFDRDRVEVLVNRVGKRRGLGPADFSKVLGPPARRSFPEDSLAVQRALASGEPLAAGSPLGRAIEDFAEELTRAEAAVHLPMKG
jgi:pilus assembly protein CpaE